MSLGAAAVEGDEEDEALALPADADIAPMQAALQALTAQQAARKARFGMWQYGDADSDEEEPVRGAWGRRCYKLLGAKHQYSVDYGMYMHELARDIGALPPPLALLRRFVRHACAQLPSFRDELLDSAARMAQATSAGDLMYSGDRPDNWEALLAEAPARSAADVLIGKRNQKCVEAVTATEGDAHVLYGVAHLRDLDGRLRKAGYARQRGEEWSRAFAVPLAGEGAAARTGAGGVRRARWAPLAARAAASARAASCCSALEGFGS
mgnify:CR=1 FL=1